MKCTIHPHSSDKTAEKCAATRKQRKVDRRLRLHGAVNQLSRYLQVHHNPPIRIQVGNIEVLYFYSGRTEKPSKAYLDPDPDRSQGG